MKKITLLLLVLSSLSINAQSRDSLVQEYDIVATNNKGKSHLLVLDKWVYLRLKEDPEEKRKGILSIVDSSHVVLSSDPSRMIDISEIVQIDAESNVNKSAGIAVMSVSSGVGLISGIVAVISNNNSSAWSAIPIVVIVASVAVLASLASRKKYKVPSNWTLTIVPKVL